MDTAGNVTLLSGALTFPNGVAFRRREDALRRHQRFESSPDCCFRSNENGELATDAVGRTGLMHVTSRPQSEGLV